MGQSVTLYRIDRNDISKVIDNPNGFELLKITKGYETFIKSFEGLRFVLAKGLEPAKKALIELIFYPKTYFGEQIDFSTIDFENLPEDFDFEKQPVSYNDPKNVSEISSLLDSISLDKFRSNFDHNELNREDIYPGDIWNDEATENIAFNFRHLSVEFQKLKSFFKTAVDNEDYLLSYNG